MCHNLELLQSNLICLPVALVSIVEGVLTQFFKSIFCSIVNTFINIWCRFEDLLRSLTVERKDICDAMIFALDNADSAFEVRSPALQAFLGFRRV